MTAPTKDRIPLAELLRGIRDTAPRIAVIGDHLLDGWWQGSTERMSREAPAPVVDIARREYAPGGAANTAMNLAALGARVSAVGLIGDDAAGRRLRGLLAAERIDVTGLLPVPGAQTTTKYRIVGADQLMVRLDDTQRGGWPEESLRELARAALAATRDADAEIVCDYGSDTLTGPLRDALLARRSRPAWTLVDAHDPSRWRELRPRLITPNAAEAASLLDVSLGSGAERVEVVADKAGRRRSLTGADAAVVTLDRDGTVLLRPGVPAHRTRAHPAVEKQASGAGDTFVAALTLAAVRGAPLEDAVELAQIAADVAVQKPGTCVSSSAELQARLGRMPDLTLGASELSEKLEEHRRQGRRIVFTNGCFDVLHRGHTSYLRQARQLGDVLVVAVNDDDSVRRLKGPGRPINPALDRANVLAELSCVDYVTVFGTDTPIPLLRLLRPDVYAKGGDYTPEMLEETPVVRESGGEVVIVDYVPEHSTTAVVDRIRAQSGSSGAPSADSREDLPAPPV